MITLNVGNRYLTVQFNAELVTKLDWMNIHPLGFRAFKIPGVLQLAHIDNKFTLLRCDQLPYYWSWFFFDALDCDRYKEYLKYIAAQFKQTKEFKDCVAAACIELEILCSL